MRDRGIILREGKMSYKTFKACAAIIVAAYFILYSQNIFAQAINTKDGPGPGSVSIRDDMKSYEIICTEHAKEYAEYYRMLKDRIVRKLRSNYKVNYAPGDVDMYFVLNRDGALIRMDIDIEKSVNDKRLIDIAILSVQQASPFPAFPKELDAAKMPFELTISFKKE